MGRGLPAALVPAQLHSTGVSQAGSSIAEKWLWGWEIPTEKNGEACYKQNPPPSPHPFTGMPQIQTYSSQLVALTKRSDTPAAFSFAACYVNTVKVAGGNKIFMRQI